MNKNMKRTIIMAFIYSIGVGCLSLLIGSLAPISHINIFSKNYKEGQEVLNNTNDNTIDNLYIENAENTNINSMVMSKANITTALADSNETPTQSPTPTPTPPPVYELERGAYPDIDKFFQDYYVAYNCCDYDRIKGLVTDTDNMVSINKMEKETKFIDDIRNITCYVMKSYEDDSYIVYVYYDLKYVNIKSTYPILDKFYLITDDKGEFKIFTSEMDETLKTYYDERDLDEKVKGIIEMAEYRQDDVLEKDTDLKDYLEALNNL